MEQVKFHIGKYLLPVKIIKDGNYLYIYSGFSRKLIEELKNMEGARWEPKKKAWKIKDSKRNRFALSYLKGERPYDKYKKELVPYSSDRKLFDHQLDMVRKIITYRSIIIAGEMGTGKTLAVLEAMEYFKFLNNWYIGPKAGVRAVNREIIKWNSKVRPVMMTYEGLVKKMKSGYNPPDFIVFDESSKIKNPSAIRSQACITLANDMRSKNNKSVIVLMSGTPAPRNPTDWWHQCEVACPGFLKEPNIHKFKKRLCIIEERESLSGGVYPHIVTWKDDINKCDICGRFEDSPIHKDLLSPNYHIFKYSKNEISGLYRRTKGLVSIYLKKNCLDLPDKSYEVITLKPTVEILRSAHLIKQTSTRAIEALTKLRELSDGFQYSDEIVRYEKCKSCLGSGQILAPVPVNEIEFKEGLVKCPTCKGRGEAPIKNRVAKQIKTPKDDCLIELLDQHSEIGRFVIWCGFTATIDKVTEYCLLYGWSVLRIDGRGFKGFNPDGRNIDSEELLAMMDASSNKKEGKVCVVAHAGSGGMALTLTASPSCLYYSNDFNGEYRMQSEDRIHRVGIKSNPIIYDLILLKTDKLILENLKNKKSLQSITMGDIEL